MGGRVERVEYAPNILHGLGRLPEPSSRRASSDQRAGTDHVKGQLAWAGISRDRARPEVMAIDQLELDALAHTGKQHALVARRHHRHRFRAR